MPGGRPTKLNDELCKDIIESIKEGIPPATAAELNGISKRTYERWMKRGREAKRKTQYSEFCRKVMGAKAFASKKLLHKILDSKDWKAQRYLLTLLDPDTYNDSEKVELEHSGEIKTENRYKHTIELIGTDEFREQELGVLRAANKEEEEDKS